MNETTAPVVHTRVPVWAWGLVLLAAFGMYLTTLDNGWVLQQAAHRAHEFFHDGRHFFGVPCH